MMYQWDGSGPDSVPDTAGKRMGIPGMPRQGWGLALAGALSVATAWAAVEWQHARNAQPRHVVDDRMPARLAQCARRVHALELERDLRRLLSERSGAAPADDPVPAESKERLGEVGKELAEIETSISDLKGRMVRIPPSAIEAIPEGPDVARARQSDQAVSADLVALETRLQHDAPQVGRKREEKERLDRELAAAFADDLARRKNLAFKSLEDALVEQVEGRKVRVEERDRLRIELASVTRAAPPAAGGSLDSDALSSLARDLAADPSDPQGWSEAEDDSAQVAAGRGPAESGSETGGMQAFPPFPFLLGCLVGVVCALLMRRADPRAKVPSESQETRGDRRGPHSIGRVA